MMTSDLSFETCYLVIFDFVIFGGILMKLLSCISICLKNHIIVLWLLHAALQRFIILTFMNIVINLKQIMVVKSMENSQFFRLIGIVVIVSLYSTENKRVFILNLGSLSRIRSCELCKHMLAKFQPMLSVG